MKPYTAVLFTTSKYSRVTRSELWDLWMHTCTHQSSQTYKQACTVCDLVTAHQHVPRTCFLTDIKVPVTWCHGIPWMGSSERKAGNHMPCYMTSHPCCNNLRPDIVFWVHHESQWRHRHSHVSYVPFLLPCLSTMTYGHMHKWGHLMAWMDAGIIRRPHSCWIMNGSSEPHWPSPSWMCCIWISTQFWNVCWFFVLRRERISSIDSWRTFTSYALCSASDKLCNRQELIFCTSTWKQNYILWL
jgi:hypothetical protein